MAYTPCREDYVQCPYEKAHIILIDKLQFHLTKCEYVNRVNSPLTECPFNSTHRIRELEMNYHKLHFCPDRKKLDTFVYSIQDATPLHPVVTVEVESTEDWDDFNSPTYNPQEHCKDKPILMSVQGVTPSERKDFRIKQRRKMQALAGNNSEHCEAAPSNNRSRLPNSDSQVIIHGGQSFYDNNAQYSSGNDYDSMKQAENKFQVIHYVRGRARARGNFKRH